MQDRCPTTDVLPRVQGSSPSLHVLSGLAKTPTLSYGTCCHSFVVLPTMATTNSLQILGTYQKGVHPTHPALLFFFVSSIHGATAQE